MNDELVAVGATKLDLGMVLFFNRIRSCTDRLVSSLISDDLQHLTEQEFFVELIKTASNLVVCLFGLPSFAVATVVVVE